MIRSYKNISPTIPASCYVDESAQIIGDVALGEHASIWMNAVLRGDVHSIRVGAYSNIQDCSVLHGMKEQYGVFVGEYVTVGHSVTLHGCTIDDRCLIGMGSIILNGAKIGAGSIIAAGAVVSGKKVGGPGAVDPNAVTEFATRMSPSVVMDTRYKGVLFTGGSWTFLRENQRFWDSGPLAKLELVHIVSLSSLRPMRRPRGLFFCSC